MDRQPRRRLPALASSARDQVRVHPHSSSNAPQGANADPKHLYGCPDARLLLGAETVDAFILPRRRFTLPHGPRLQDRHARTIAVVPTASGSDFRIRTLPKSDPPGPNWLN